MDRNKAAQTAAGFEFKCLNMCSSSKLKSFCATTCLKVGIALISSMWRRRPSTNDSGLESLACNSNHHAEKYIYWTGQEIFSSRSEDILVVHGHGETIGLYCLTENDTTSHASG